MRRAKSVQTIGFLNILQLKIPRLRAHYESALAYSHRGWRGDTGRVPRNERSRVLGVRVRGGGEPASRRDCFKGKVTFPYNPAGVNPRPTLRTTAGARSTPLRKLAVFYSSAVAIINQSGYTPRAIFQRLLPRRELRRRR